MKNSKNYIIVSNYNILILSQYVKENKWFASEFEQINKLLVPIPTHEAYNLILV